RRKRKSETFDDRDEAIIHCIEQDPAILLKAIPHAITDRGGKPIPYPTVQRRVKDLMRVGVVEHRYYINWSKAGYLVRYRVGILIDPVALRKRGPKSDDYETQEELALFIKKKLAQTEGFRNKLVVDDVHILLGASVDLSVDFYARDDKTATEFIINALRQQRGISNTVSAKLAFSSRYGWLSKDGNEHGS
ncbi:MAG TPA: hypothetical protein VIW74_14410, partial [Pyrinomonadaceae bacterium]